MKLEKLKKKLIQIDPNIEAFEKDNCIFLIGEVDDYQKVVKAGQSAVDKKRYLGVVNDIKVKGFKQKVVLPNINDNKYDQEECDVLIIGGGVVGCATARELSKYKLKIMLVEKGPDVASGQSSRNGGVVHVGINFSTNSKRKPLRINLITGTLRFLSCSTISIKVFKISLFNSFSIKAMSFPICVLFI